MQPMGQNNRKTFTVLLVVCPDRHRFQTWDILAPQTCSVGTLGYSLINRDSSSQTGTYDHLVLMNSSDHLGSTWVIIATCHKSRWLPVSF